METLNEDNPRRSLANMRVGKNVRFFNFVNPYGCEVDDGTKVGSFVEIQKNAKIGRDCEISSRSFICEGVEIQDGVFIGHNLSSINGKFPHATNANGAMQTDADWTMEKTLVKARATVGTGATILGGVTLGCRALIGACSVVTKDVRDDAVVAGNPVRPISKKSAK